MLMRFATHVARILLGLLFFVFGLNGFLHFAPLPPLPEKASAFMQAILATGYLMPLIKGVETITGALLLANIAVPFALVLLAPIHLNILLFHAYLTPPDAWGMSIVFSLLHIFVMWRYRDYYRPLFTLFATQHVCPLTCGVRTAAPAGSTPVPATSP